MRFHNSWELRCLQNPLHGNFDGGAIEGGMISMEGHSSYGGAMEGRCKSGDTSGLCGCSLVSPSIPSMESETFGKESGAEVERFPATNFNSKRI